MRWVLYFAPLFCSKRWKSKVKKSGKRANTFYTKESAVARNGLSGTFSTHSAVYKICRGQKKKIIRKKRKIINKRWAYSEWSAAGGTNWTINFICIVIVPPPPRQGNSPFTPSFFFSFFLRLNSESPHFLYYRQNDRS